MRKAQEEWYQFLGPFLRVINYRAFHRITSNKEAKAILLLLRIVLAVY